MASVRTRALRDGTLTHSVLFRLDGRQTSETFDTLAAARAFARDVDKHGPDAARRILDSRRLGREHVRTLAEQVDAHIRTLSGITIGTRRRYEAIAREIADHRLGALPLEAVRMSDVADWIRDLADSGLGSSSIDVRRAVLSGAITRAMRDELIDRNPMAGIRIPRTEAHKEPAFLTRDEFATVRDCAQPDDRPLLITLVTTGLRIGEATALQVRDLHLWDVPATLTVSRGWQSTNGPERITGAPKTERGRRTIALSPDVVVILRRQVEGKEIDDWVFVDRNGLPVQRNRLGERWRAAVKASGLRKRPRLHDLRHTHASWMLQEGISLTTLQHRLGHSSIKITSDTYGHLLPEAQVQAARASGLIVAGQVFTPDTPMIGGA